MGSARAIVMKFLVLLSIVSLACGAPMPEGEEAPVAVEAEAPAAVEEEAPAALPYVHDATGDVAEAYVLPKMLRSLLLKKRLLLNLTFMRKSLQKCMSMMLQVILLSPTSMKTLLLKFIHTRSLLFLLLLPLLHTQLATPQLESSLSPRTQEYTQAIHSHILTAYPYAVYHTLLLDASTM